MKRKYVVFLGVFALLLAVGIQVVEQVDAPFLSVKANPYFSPTELVPAPSNIDLIFNIASPNENAIYSNGTINVSLNVRVVDPNGLCENVYVTGYQGDWMQTNTSPPIEWDSLIQKNQIRQYNFTITDIPFGEHTMNFTGHTQGDFMENDTNCFFELDKTVSTKFFVQTKPIIKFLIPENANSSKLSFPLNFTVDHPVSEIAYCLDEQESVPINGNTTLTDLPNGQHNVTVYATDEFGYTGKSETLFFNVNAPESTEFSVVPLVIAFVIIVVIVGAGWLVYFRRRKVQP